uniref:Ig-like domain-containing protein n=1 Tax=Amphiprion percula TaxID=161767 RepID=A0A3P8TIG4_AMPPE
MPPQINQRSPLRTFTLLVFHLLLTHFCRGESQVIGPSQPIVASVGADIILPCHVEPTMDATAEILEWMRSDLNPRFVHVWRSGQDVMNARNPSYRGRTSLFINELKHGNISVKLSKVELSDEGTYECYIPKLDKQSFVKLIVVSGAVSQPVTTLAGIDGKGGVVLQCESAGWYPEPEVLWLDAEGNLLSAGPTETVRGPDDLYSVSSRVTVEKKHGNKFTCRVQQNNINQTRDTWIHVPHDFFVVQSCSTSTTVSLAVCMVVSIILFILAVVVFVHTRRQNRTKRREDVQVKCEEEALMLMKTLEKEKQPESKRVNKEAEVSLLIDEERHQDQLKEEELNPEEQQRKKEAENMIQRLKEKLDMKKNKFK